MKETRNVPLEVLRANTRLENAAFTRASHRNESAICASWLEKTDECGKTGFPQYACFVYKLNCVRLISWDATASNNSWR